MNGSTKSLSSIRYMVVIFLAIVSVDIIQVYNGELDMSCFPELIDGETESEEKESNEKTEFNFFGNRIFNNQLFSRLSDNVELNTFCVFDNRMIDVITPPPEFSLG